MYVKEKILVNEGDLFVFSSFPGNNASCRVKYQVMFKQTEIGDSHGNPDKTKHVILEQKLEKMWFVQFHEI